jgi:hypothetical protein
LDCGQWLIIELHRLNLLHGFGNIYLKIGLNVELVFLGFIVLGLMVPLDAVVLMLRVLHGDEMWVVFSLVGFGGCSSNT